MTMRQPGEQQMSNEELDLIAFGGEIARLVEATKLPEVNKDPQALEMVNTQLNNIIAQGEEQGYNANQAYEAYKQAEATHQNNMQMEEAHGLGRQQGQEQMFNEAQGQLNRERDMLLQQGAQQGMQQGIQQGAQQEIDRRKGVVTNQALDLAEQIAGMPNADQDPAQQQQMQQMQQQGMGQGMGRRR